MLQRSRARRKKGVSNVFFSLSPVVLGSKLVSASKMAKNGDLRLPNPYAQKGGIIVSSRDKCFHRVQLSKVFLPFADQRLHAHLLVKLPGIPLGPM